MVIDKQNRKDLAIWAITPNGAELAFRISRDRPDSDLYVSQSININNAYKFKTLSVSLKAVFYQYKAHIFIMATGIVVRVIAPYIIHKTKDPAIVTIDDKGQYVISLLSGHLGGANELALKIAHIINATPIITTATDINQKPSIDLIAKEKELYIENPKAIKDVNMAFLKDEKVSVYDPFGFFKQIDHFFNFFEHIDKFICAVENGQPGVFIDDSVIEMPCNVLTLRPKTIIAGIGCNRGTCKQEIKDLLSKSLIDFRLSINSLKSIASVDIKHDEDGIIMLASDLGLDLKFFSKKELGKVDTIQTPSSMVEKHIGVKSVCEAAAILAANMGKLVVPKQKTKNATIAISRICFT